ncbi:PIN domain-containing protein [Candidatus Woesebacteria bacterium]|nr:PIN domain-containing protein [Candidatus Woesebacteria bacterium]
MIFLDSNYLLRFITNDIPDQATKARFILKKNSIYISSIVLAEVVYFLIKHYKIDKTKVCRTVMTLLKQHNIGSPIYSMKSFEIYQEENISYYDSLLLAEVLENKGVLKSFDKKLEKVFKRYNELK